MVVDFGLLLDECSSIINLNAVTIMLSNTPHAFGHIIHVLNLSNEILTC